MPQGPHHPTARCWCRPSVAERSPRAKSSPWGAAALIPLHLSELGNAPTRHPPPGRAWLPWSSETWTSRCERGTIWTLSPRLCPPQFPWDYSRVPAARRGAGGDHGHPQPKVLAPRGAGGGQQLDARCATRMRGPGAPAPQETAPPATEVRQDMGTGGCPGGVPILLGAQDGVLIPRAIPAVGMGPAQPDLHGVER